MLEIPWEIGINIVILWQLPPNFIYIFTIVKIGFTLKPIIYIIVKLFLSIKTESFSPMTDFSVLFLLIFNF